jgi:hypothetical protein
MRLVLRLFSGKTSVYTPCREVEEEKFAFERHVSRKKSA